GRGRRDGAAADGGGRGHDLEPPHPTSEERPIDQKSGRCHPDRRRRAHPPHHRAAAVHRRAASVRLLQHGELLDPDDRQSLPAACAVSDGELRQRRGPLQQAADVRARTRMCRMGRRRAHPPRLARGTGRGHPGLRHPARDRGGQRLLERGRRSRRVHDHRRDDRVQVPGRSAQPEDHPLDVRGVQPQRDTLAGPSAPRGRSAAGGLAQDAGRARLLRALPPGVDQRVAEPAEPEERIMPKKEVIKVELAAANPNLSPATRYGGLVFVAGQTGRHPVTGQLGSDIREQTRNVLERIKKVLEAAGTSLDNVLTVTTHLTNRDNLAAYNEEYAKYFPTNKPARTTVTAILNAPELLVEITVTACMPD